MYSKLLILVAPEVTNKNFYRLFEIRDTNKRTIFLWFDREGTNLIQHTCRDLAIQWAFSGSFTFN